jgi:hypothetical protein
VAPGRGRCASYVYKARMTNLRVETLTGQKVASTYERNWERRSDATSRSAGIPYDRRTGSAMVDAFQVGELRTGKSLNTPSWG